MNYSIYSETDCVTLQEQKLFSRIDNNSEDALLSSLIVAAQTYCREATGRIPYASVVDFRFPSWLEACPRNTLGFVNVEQAMIASRWANLIELPYSTASQVAVYYYDSNGDEQTIDPDNYVLLDRNSVSSVFFKTTYSLPTLDTNTPLPIRIRATYGPVAETEETDAVPAPKETKAFKILVMSLANYWYTQREPVVTGSIATKLPLTFDALANSIRTGALLK